MPWLILSNLVFIWCSSCTLVCSVVALALNYLLQTNKSILKMTTDDDPLALALRSMCFRSGSQALLAS